MPSNQDPATAFEVTVEQISPASLFVTGSGISGLVPKVAVRGWQDDRITPGSRVTIEVRNWFLRQHAETQKEQS